MTFLQHCKNTFSIFLQYHKNWKIGIEFFRLFCSFYGTIKSQKRIFPRNVYEVETMSVLDFPNESIFLWWLFLSSLSWTYFLCCFVLYFVTSLVLWCVKSSFLIVTFLLIYLLFHWLSILNKFWGFFPYFFIFNKYINDENYWLCWVLLIV